VEPTLIEAPRPDPAGSAPAGAEAVHPEPAPDLVEDDLLVEEISIDGMCGVY
jgi:mycofactocin precursor